MGQKRPWTTTAKGCCLSTQSRTKQRSSARDLSEFMSLDLDRFCRTLVQNAADAVINAGAKFRW